MAMFILKGVAHDLRIHQLAYLFPHTSIEFDVTVKGEAGQGEFGEGLHQSGKSFQTPSLRAYMHQARFQDPDIDLIKTGEVIVAIDNVPMTPVISVATGRAVLQAINVRCEHPERFINEDAIIEFDLMDVIGKNFRSMEDVDREQNPEKYENDGKA